MKQLQLEFKRNFRQEAEEFYALRKATGVPMESWVTVQFFENAMEEYHDKEWFINQYGMYATRKRRVN